MTGTEEQSQALWTRFLAAGREHAVLCLDTAGCIVGWEAGSAQVFGYTAEEVIGRPASLIFTPEDRAAGADVFELQVAARSGRADDDRWHLRKDGARIWVSGTVEALRDDSGALLGYVKVVRDRTDLRSRVERLEEDSKELGRDRQRGRTFLSTLGHELRNSLAPLANANHILSRLSTEARAVRAVEVIRRQLEVLAKLAEDMMDLSRAGTSAIRLETRECDLRSMLGDAAAAVRDAAEAKGLRLECLLPAEAVVARVDPQRFERVVLNLLGNAIKYTPSGGRVWLQATRQPGEVQLRVRDDGIGIAADMLPRIFELFTQERQAQEMAPSGLGLGLTVVKQLVELHGGTIQARSAGRGKGAEFIVRLPSARSEP
jgi:PAS domain S-box-containing protein